MYKEDRKGVRETESEREGREEEGRRSVPERERKGRGRGSDRNRPKGTD